MSSRKNNSIILIVALTLICAVAGFALAFTYKHCCERIFKQIKQNKTSARNKVLPDAVRFEGVQGRKMEYFVGYNDAGDTVGYTFEGSAAGYSSEIKVVVGVNDTAETITGIFVTSQQETPGLGANMEAVKTEGTLWTAIGSIFAGKPTEKKLAEPYFQAQFRGKTLDRLKVEKTKETPYIEALTGATISSEAVTTAVRGAVEKFRKEELGTPYIEALTGATVSSKKED